MWLGEKICDRRGRRARPGPALCRTPRELGAQDMTADSTVGEITAGGESTGFELDVAERKRAGSG